MFCFLFFPQFGRENLNYIINILYKNSNIDTYALSGSHQQENVTKQDYKSIKTLANEHGIVISTADKKLGFIINHTQWYANEYQRQLADKDVYHKKHILA